MQRKQKIARATFRKIIKFVTLNNTSDKGYKLICCANRENNGSFFVPDCCTLVQRINVEALILSAKRI